MLRRSWQAAMIRLARSPMVVGFMQGNRAMSFLANKYVAGQDPANAVKVAGDLLAVHGTCSSLYYLGEYVNHPDLVVENVANKIAVVQALGHTDFDVHVSVDPTQIGYSIDSALARENAQRISREIHNISKGRPGIHCLMFDMEDASVIDATITLHNELKQGGYPVALTLQAYLRRTVSDIQAQIDIGSRVRLVKGAFAADSNIAYTRQEDIKANYRRLVEMMFSDDARQMGFYPIVATHDSNIHKFTIDVARRNGWKSGQYEFEMLHGVRSDVARDLVKRGERVRIYLPFGRDWWSYAVRRIGENPRNAFLLARSLIN